MTKPTNKKDIRSLYAAIGGIVGLNILFFVAGGYIIGELRYIEGYNDGKYIEFSSFSINNSGEKYFIENIGATGVYFPSENTYCVRIKGRTPQEIARTDYHEMCHVLIDVDYAHFCNKNNSSRKYLELNKR